jgi:hypothetical protein
VKKEQLEELNKKYVTRWGQRHTSMLLVIFWEGIMGRESGEEAGGGCVRATEKTSQLL